MAHAVTTQVEVYLYASTELGDLFCRVALATALFLAPDVLLLDEPTVWHQSILLLWRSTRCSALMSSYRCVESSRFSSGAVARELPH